VHIISGSGIDFGTVGPVLFEWKQSFAWWPTSGLKSAARSTRAAATVIIIHRLLLPPYLVV